MINEEIERGHEKGSTDAGDKSVAPPPDTYPNRVRKREPLKELPLEFHGVAGEYFRIWIVNLCLTLLTLGIFSAWAKVRKKRYLYSHTTIGGTPLQYLARPIPILKGRLIAAAGFLIYYVSTHFITSIFPYVIAAGFVVAPWVLVRSFAFKARYSAFRNMTFHFDGGYLDAAKVIYVWGLVPAFFIVMIFDFPQKPVFLGIGSFLFAVYFPWWIRGLKNLIISHTSYGGINGEFSARGGQFFGIYFVAGVILIAVSFPFMLITTFIMFKAINKTILPYIVLIPIYAAYIVSFAYITARSGNLVWNNTRLGPVCFQSTLRCWDLVKLYITNALGIIFSLGVLTPWAIMRTLKYRADHMQVFQYGLLAEFKGSDMTAVDAVGIETMDFFDVDISL